MCRAYKDRNDIYLHVHMFVYMTSICTCKNVRGDAAKLPCYVWIYGA